MRLQCSECHYELDLHDRRLSCPKCGELLELEPEVECEPGKLKRLWAQRRVSDDPRDLSGVWRFREFLPEYPVEAVVTMGEGNCPIVRGNITAEYAGLRNLWFKHLGWNPTACFKDLGMTVGVTEAKVAGAKIVACASTGNTSGSLAAYGARAGLKVRVYLPEGKISVNKLAQTLDYGADVVQIKGSFDAALDAVIESSKENIYLLNSINPFRIEGQKTTMFHLCEQFGWDPPDYLIVPGGNLGNSSAFGKGFEELKAAGLIEHVPKLVVVQAAGANPLAQMWRRGAAELVPVEHPETMATAIRIGNPRSWRKALRAVKFTGGWVMDVTDEEIAEAKEVIGRDGIGCEPASATTLAALHKLAGEKKIEADARVVAILTGHVLKDTEFIIRREQGRLRDASTVGMN
ncbi:MAG: threonine synthase [Terriglobia bacterium]|nr:threonine synthase [Terriglobia bacterium]